MNAKERIEYLIAHPDELIKKKPFTRGFDKVVDDFDEGCVRPGETLTAELPRDERKVVSQSTFMKELDPHSHKVLFDKNIPSITAKLEDGGYHEIEFKRMAVPFQKRILEKHVLYLCGYDVQHTLDIDDPTEEQKKDFALFKKMWKKRNQGGMRTKMVSAQKAFGDAGLLFYMDRNERIKSRLISYEDGYVICSHNDENGDRLLESVYYRDGEKECIDTFSDDMQYHHERKPYSDDEEENAWKLTGSHEHGFEEIPLVTKRGKVAWNDVQDTIEVYEIIYNVFLVIQKRHGWGVLYIKGAFSEKARKLAGSVILNDNSLNKDGDAKYLTPPTPEGMLDTLKLMEETIQKGSGCTFILPKDITTGGDISGVAIQITQSLDNEEALGGVIEWQNVASKMSRLFLYGLAKEMHGKGDATAVTRMSALDVHSEFRQWRPRNDVEYNQMLTTLKGAGLISCETGIEKNTESAPDEQIRVEREAKEAEEKELRMQEAQQQDNSNQTE